MPKSCLQGNASPANLEETCPSFPWSQSERSQSTKSGLRVFGFCPAGSTKWLDLSEMPAREPSPIASHWNRSSDTCSMTRRLTTALLAVVLLLQGCTIQKRSVTSGWHVERAGRVSSVTSSKSSGMLVEVDKESNQHAVAVVSNPHIPPLPLRALMAYTPPVSTTSENPKMRSTEKKRVRESCPGHEVGSDDKREATPDPSMDDSSAWKRIFMGLLALALDVASVPVISLGFWFGSWALVMFIALGAGLLYVSWFAWLAAFPKFRSRTRKRRNWEAKKQQRDEKRQARENEATWLKNLPLVVLVATAVLFFMSLVL